MLLRTSLVAPFLAVVLFLAALFAQSPELSLREFASGQIKKGVRSIGFGGDGATGGNYALVYHDAGVAFVDGGLTRCNLFGKTSNSVLATLTFDMTWLGAQCAPLPEVALPPSPAGSNQHP